MCGIGGFRGKLFSQRKELVLSSLVEGLKSRGEHAVGIGFYNKDKGKVFKAPVKPSQVDWKTLFSFSPCLSDTVIFHNRFATHGKPEINKNNHPFAGEGFLLAHNGVLSNYKELLKEYDLVVSDKEPETDSYALVKILNKLTKEKNMDMVESLKELCPKVNGSMVLTILCEDGRLILVRGSKYSYKLYRINGENYIYASAANTKGQKEHIDIALEPLLLDLYKETEGNFTIEKIDVPEWSICIINPDGSLQWESFEKPKVVSTVSYSNSFGKSGSYKMDLTPKTYRQRSFFENDDDDDDYYNYNNSYLSSYKKNSTYINDVMDVLQDEWDTYSDKKFDYNLVRDIVESEVSGCEDIFPPSIMAEELISNGSLDELMF